MINRGLANVVTESLSRPVAFALPGRSGGGFRAGRGASCWNAGCFSAWLPFTSGTGPGNLAVWGGPSCHRRFPDGGGRSGWNGSPRDRRAAIAWVTEAGRRRDLVQGHLELARPTIDPASKSFLSDFLYGLADQNQETCQTERDCRGEECLVLLLRPTRVSPTPPRPPEILKPRPC